MALIQSPLFPALFGGRAPATSPELWFAMQWAMLLGFANACPANWLLIRVGINERRARKSPIRPRSLPKAHHRRTTRLPEMQKTPGLPGVFYGGTGGI
ncbi:DUF4396 domain-containing protein [Leifsonia sp. AG29]|uniref:DUF4396 domain-containing protein n=1 Tax=Leifsonia sp. AG29 TaxID=2598860 RepID=UPI00131B1CD3|nr:DUF4396 domain-containing protein [Leifsonia sp. AG29]